MAPPAGSGSALSAPGSAGQLQGSEFGQSQKVEAEIEAERLWWSEVSERQVKELESSFGVEFQKTTDKLRTDIARAQDRLELLIDAERRERQAAIAELTDSVAAMADSIATGEADIKDLDKTVAQATEQRKEEHEDFLGSQQLNEAAMQLIEKAKNRLQKFYNPTLYKAPPKTENTMEEKIIIAGTFVQIKAHDEEDSDENFSTQYQKSEKSAGVIGLMDMMVREIETDMKDAEYGEKTAQSDYGKLMADSEETRTATSKMIVTKTASKAETEAKLDAAKDALTAVSTDLDLIAATTGDLHMQCDFLLQNYDLRMEARTNEIESLKNAKAILSGADFR